MKLRDFLPLKAICEDLGVSRWTLWRAAGSNIPDFPPPTRVGRQIFWKKAELEALEAALLQFKGRCVFDSKRRHEKKVKGLTRSRAAASPRKRVARVVQEDLFS
jgi:predicted DNA-binding transcriptional regulator AlpA